MRRKLPLILGLIAAAVIGGGAPAWFRSTRADAPPPPAFVTATSGAPAPSTPGAPPATGAPAATTAPATAAASGVEGEWTVQANEATYVGYRVSEQLANLPTRNDAVGR